MNMIEKSYKMAVSWITIIKFKIRYGNRFQCNWSDMISPSVKVRISSGGKVIIGKRVGLRDNIILNSTGGTIIIEDKVFINDYTCINSREKIIIGSGSVIGQGVKIYDHDHDYRNNMQKDFICIPVKIEHDVWIGSDSIVLKGCSIGENSVIGAMTLLNEDVPASSVVFNERTSKLRKINKNQMGIELVKN